MTNWKKMSFLDSTRKSEDRLELWKNSRSSLALMVLRLLFPSCGICWGAVPFFLLSNYSASTLLLTKSCTFPQRFNLFIPKNTGSVFSPMPKMTYPALLTRSDQIWNFEASTSIRFTMIQDLIFKIFFNTPREKLTTQTSRAGKLYTHELLGSSFDSTPSKSSIPLGEKSQSFWSRGLDAFWICRPSSYRRFFVDVMDWVLKCGHDGRDRLSLGLTPSIQKAWKEKAQ